MPEKCFNLKQTSPRDGKGERGRAQAAPDPTGQNSFAAGAFPPAHFHGIGKQIHQSQHNRKFPKIPQGMSSPDIQESSSLPYSSSLHFTFILILLAK